MVGVRVKEKSKLTCGGYKYIFFLKQCIIRGYTLKTKSHVQVHVQFKNGKCIFMISL